MVEIIQPTSLLKKFIKYYCIVEVNDPVGFLPNQRVYPMGDATLVFHYNQPSKFKKKNSNDYVEPRFVICGPQTEYYDISLSGKTGMVFVLFKPQGISAFFKEPVSDLHNQNIALSDILNIEAIELEERLSNYNNSNQRVLQLENFLIKRLTINKDYNRINHAITLINNTKGQIKSHDLAQETCLGIKQFEKIFTKHVGMNPKKFLSITRFQNVLKMKKQQPELKMFQLAFDNGYYDHSHFNHDFKSITDMSPKAFFKEIQE